MKIEVIGCRKSNVSAERLKGYVAAEPTFAGNPEICVNLGNSGARTTAGITINNPSAIHNAANKRKFFELAGDNYPVPAFFVLPESETALRARLRAGEKYVVRCEQGRYALASTRFRKLVSSEREFDEVKNRMTRNGTPPILATKFIDKAREWRAIVLNGNVIKVMRKLPNDSADTKYQSWEWKQDNCQFVKSNMHTETFVKACVGAAKVLGDSHLVGIDICEDNNNRLYVLEVNTGMALGDDTCKLLIEKFKEILTPRATARIARYAEPVVRAAPTPVPTEVDVDVDRIDWVKVIRHSGDRIGTVKAKKVNGNIVITVPANLLNL